MKDNLLNRTEKTKLTDYAREVVARNARASAAKPEAKAPVDTVDTFSPEGLRTRLAALEKDFEALDRKVGQNLSTILTTLQRIEARASQTSGELRAVREELDARAGSAAYARDELMAAAKDYGAILNGEIARLVERLDSVNGPATATANGAAAPTESEPPGAGRDGSATRGSGARRDG